MKFPSIFVCSLDVLFANSIHLSKCMQVNLKNGFWKTELIIYIHFLSQLVITQNCVRGDKECTLFEHMKHDSII